MPDTCLGPWQIYGCEWSIGYLWHWTSGIARLDIFVLALMLAYVVIVVSRGSVRYHLACRRSRVFVRDVASALHTGAFDEVLRIAARTRGNPIAAMVAAGLTAFATVPRQFTPREATGAADGAFQRAQRAFAADLSLGVEALRSIGVTAPYLGLVGTCIGMMSAFMGIGMQRQTALVMITTYLAASLFTTAAGLIVAAPAVWAYNYLRVRIDGIESEMSNVALEAITLLNAHPDWRNRFIAGSAIETAGDAVASEGEVRHEERLTDACSRIAGKLPLTKQFSKLPAFALIAAQSLAIVVTAFTSFASFRHSMGLEVRVSRPSDLETRGDVSVKPILIRLIEATPMAQTTVKVNSKKTPWEALGSTVRNELKLRPQATVYVEAENNVPWADVAKMIDIVEALPADVALTRQPRSDSRRLCQSCKSAKN